jgi:YVTN family beta-propeller protein
MQNTSMRGSTGLRFNNSLRAGLCSVTLLASLACSRHESKPPYLVYVTNESSGNLTVIDPNKPEPLETIALGKRPRGIHAHGPLILVALSGSPMAPPGVDESTLPPPDRSADGIGVYDLREKKLTRKLFGGSDPEEFAFSKDGKRLYVANEDASGLSVVDLDTGNVSKTLPAGEEPEGVTLSPDGRFVYVTSENDGLVTVVDTATTAVVKTIKTGRRPRSISFLPDSSRAYVTNENDASLTVVDAVRHEPLRTISLEAGMKPMGQAMTKDGSRLFVSTGRGGKVVALETASEKVVGTLDVGQRPWGVALSPDDKLLFTANGPSNDVTVVDVAAWRIVRKVRSPERPWGVVAVVPPQ